MEPWEELLFSSTRADQPMISPPAWFFFNEKLCHHMTALFNAAKWLSHKGGGIWHLLIFWGNGWSLWTPHYDSTWCLYTAVMSSAVCSDHRPCSHTSYSQHWGRLLSVGGYPAWEVWLRYRAQTAWTESSLHFFLMTSYHNGIRL